MQIELPTNYLAAIGYYLLLAFSVYKLSDTVKRPVDLLANVLLIIGLFSLIAYHIRYIKTDKDEATDKTQRTLRLTAHSTITTFLLLTLTSLSSAKFQFYDWFALVGHSTLLVSVAKQMSQFIGIGALAMYYIFATAQKIGTSGLELLNLIGRAMLMVFFSLALIRHF